MRTHRAEEFRRADKSPAPSPLINQRSGENRPSHWRIGWLGTISAICLSLAFAPFSQFYLAWVGLVPWLVFIRRTDSSRAVFFWSWIAGTIFFSINIWWLSFVTLPGTIAVVIYMGLYWGVGGLLVRSVDQHLPDSPAGQIFRVLMIAGCWTGLEWLRGNFLSGFPWSFLGYSQTPLLVMCQIADITSVYGVTFWLVMVNAFLASWIQSDWRWKPVERAGAVVSVLTLLMLGYGWWRINQTELLPGPRVLVVQSNIPQSNTGEKGLAQDELIDLHARATRSAIEREKARGRNVDLAVWSETMAPSINQAARDATRGSSYGLFLQNVYQQIASTAFDYRVAILTGGSYSGKVVIKEDRYVDLDRRNSAYFFEPTGILSDLRYDKSHLVPFGEYVPFKQTIPPLYRFFMWFSPHDFDYNLVPGDQENPTVFPIHSGGSVFRFVTPICFEDADPQLVARMVRPSSETGEKRADFLVNITNDGWFPQPQLSQHFQIARFRSIENRVATARSVNTGISGFIDPVGRIIQRLGAQVDGVSITQVPVDRRVTVFSRIGDVFGASCAVLTILIGIWAIRTCRVKHKPADPVAEELKRL